mmetsp:Transcript_35488/g.98063  ORF Transcript_35488/g.98063 Transcript_35488/m.98063 type:complete len:238 (-) Transcript_35488:32-745(-)
MCEQIHGQNLTVDIHTFALCPQKAHILPEMSGTHVLHCVKTESAHSAVEELPEMGTVHVNNLWAIPQLRPFPATPPFIALVIVPIFSTKGSPRPLEILAVEGRTNCRLQALLEPLQKPCIALGVLPLVVRCDHKHVIEDAVCNDYKPMGTCALAQRNKLGLGTQSINHPVALWLVSPPPLWTVGGLLSRTYLNCIEAVGQQLWHFGSNLLEWHEEGMENRLRCGQRWSHVDPSPLKN